uniref:Reverse transcriptase Ty1/copia-type domain-containing protein n=1 Tax=Fagus sylvatica TaxID=28930 RepID=A0A2N9G798_FAGSY
MSSSSTTTNSGSSSRTHHYPLLSSSTHLQIKLTKDNYLSWKTAITPYINGNKILHHIDGTSLPPPQYLPSSTSPPILVPNPNYLSWFEIDQLLLSILISTISDTLISSIVGLTSSRAVWTTLEKMFSSQSRARLMHTRYQLVTLKKGNLSITDFYQKAKQYSDLLASIGQPISDNDLIIHILGGLPTEYDSLVTTVNTRLADFSIDELYGHLLSHELRLEQHAVTPDLGIPAAHFAAKPPGTSTRGPQHHAASNRGSHQRYPPSCWHRFEQSYQAANSSSSQAFIAATTPVTDQVWYPDTGATNHMTADMQNLNLSAEDYMGNDQVRVGNGQVASTSHVILQLYLLIQSKIQLHICQKIELISPQFQLHLTSPNLLQLLPITPKILLLLPTQSENSADQSTKSAAPHQSTKSAALSHQPENTPHTSASLSSLNPNPPSIQTNVSLQDLDHATALSQHPMTTRSRANISKPKQMFPGLIKYPLPKALLAVHETPLHEPSCFTEASKQPQWCSAMNMEFTALLNNGTWSLVPSKPHVNLVGCKWVFRIKRHADGSIERYKARLVAKGFHQQPGIDYSETFSPVIKPITIRTVLSLAVASHWDIRQLDITNAFLHGVLSKTLHKAIYGLKQAPRAWFSRLSQRLLALGFHGSKSDTSLFIHNSGTDLIFFLIYVDDIIVTGNNKHSIARLIQALQADFALKDLGPLHFFLGVQAYTTETGLFLSQRRYISDLLKKTNMHEAKPVSSPMSSSTVLSKFGGTALSNPSTYQSVCQYMSHPTDDHWSAVKRILRYLKHTIHHGLLLHRTTTFSLQAFSDADWASCPDDRRSTTGYCIYLGRNLISWSSRKQRTVSRSSTESEYRAIAHASTEILWLQSLLTELGMKSTIPPVLWCDNIGATYLTANPLFHARTKHIEIDVHFVRDLVSTKALSIRFISSKDQVADTFTKPLPTPKFNVLRDTLNVRELPLRLRGPIKTTSSDKQHKPAMIKEDNSSNS